METFFQDDGFYLARKQKALHLRAGLHSSVRRFFNDRGFLEVDTPVRVPSPAPEEHIEAVASGAWFLQTSPELCMKRLVAAGYPKVFQICKCFRADERGGRHLPEFTMLEWYEAGIDYLELMTQCEQLLRTVFKDAGYETSLPRKERLIGLEGDWPRMTVGEAFSRHAPESARKALDGNRFEEVLTEYVEPHLGVDKPVFLYDYPAPLAALARLKQNDPSVAERFELYIDGMELANGFSELICPHEQRRRFDEAQKARAEKNLSGYIMPERFLAAVENMPPTAGIALGMDRVVMLLADTNLIDDVVAFPPESL
jgi:lysyl-tRNA synthetase class 2